MSFFKDLKEALMKVVDVVDKEAERQEKSGQTETTVAPPPPPPSPRARQGGCDKVESVF
jgi:hypothetical protein